MRYAFLLLAAGVIAGCAAQPAAPAAAPRAPVATTSTCPVQTATRLPVAGDRCGPQPGHVLDAEEIQQAGRSRVTSAIRSLPLH